MIVKTTSDRFITSSLEWYAGFYQQLIGGVSSFQELGDRVVRIAEQAQAFRQYEKVKEAAQILANIPIKQYQTIGHYYMGLCEFRKGKSPKELFEQVAEYAPARYGAFAMHSLAAIEARKQDYESEFYWYVESLKVHPSAEALRAIAVVKAKEGYHRAAIKDLENILPLARYFDPLTYFDSLNSLAVELAEVECKYEARNIIRHVIASPLAFAYPEWLETAEDLREANRSFVVINPSPLRPRNVVSMPTPEREQGELPAWAGRPAPVVNYQEWKRRMAKKKKNGNKPIEEMDVKDMLMEIMNVYTSEDTTDADRRKMYAAMMKAFFEPDKPDTPENPDDTGA